MEKCYIQTKTLPTDSVDGLKLDPYIFIFKSVGAIMYVKAQNGGVILESSTLPYDLARELREKLGDDFLHYCVR